MEDDAILLHGGAGSDNSYSERLEKYAKSVDMKSGALDACVDAVRILEDDPDFNAGTGSVKRLDGSTQMDAAVMVAEGFGSVIGIERVKNPVDVARLVMEKTPHLILEGDGAISFARKMGFPEYDPSTEKTQRMWKKTVEYLQGIGESIPERYEKYRKYADMFDIPLSTDTVGAVARIGGEICRCSIYRWRFPHDEGKGGRCSTPGMRNLCGRNGCSGSHRCW